MLQESRERVSRDGEGAAAAWQLRGVAESSGGVRSAAMAAGTPSPSCCRGGLQPLRATVTFQLQQRRGGDGGRAGNGSQALSGVGEGGR